MTVSGLKLHFSFDDLNQNNFNPKGTGGTFPTCEMWNTFSSGMQPLCVENIGQISTSSSCQNLSEHLESFDSPPPPLPPAPCSY